jgi:L-threonylcarbamoyladenylate synthase
MTRQLSPADYLEAAQILRSGGTVVIPTETVYGLGADATNPEAIARIFAAKGRPSDNPLIIHLFDPNQLDDYCFPVPALGYRLIEEFGPGPLTLVVRKKPIINSIATAGLDSVAVRFPAHPTARRILEAARLPMAAPSANRSGRPSATTWQAALEDLDGRVDAIVCDERCTIGIESTVLDLTNPIPTVLRSGSITLEQLQQIDPSIVMRTSTDNKSVNSPGLRHRHYQPTANVRLCEHPDQATCYGNEPIAYIGLQQATIDSFAISKQCKDVSDYARSLFDFFRHCDAMGIKTIWCQIVEEAGLGRALLDRLRRATE